MNKDIYPYLNLEEDFIYLFISKGLNGNIDKIVSISPLPDDLGENFKPLYNLSFGDLMGFDGKWKIEYEARMRELLKDRDGIIEAVKNSSFFKKRTRKPWRSYRN